MALIYQYTDPTTLLVNATVNRTPATATEAMYHLIQLMIESGQWVHFASNDGTTVSTPSGGSNTPASPMRITTYTGIGAGSLGATNAWVVLQHASGRLFGVQRTTAGTNTTWKIKYVPLTAAGATPVVFTVGTISQMPLFTDASDTGSKYLRGAISTFSTQFTTENTYRLNIGCDSTDGTFYFVTWTAGTASVSGHGAILFDKLLSGSFPGVGDDPNDDNDPYLWYVPSTSDSSWSAAGTAGEAAASATLSPSPQGFLRKDLAGEAFVSIPMAYLCTGSNARVLPSLLGSNPHNYKDDNLPVFYLRRAGLASPIGWKGASTLLRMNSATRATGEPLTLTTTRDRVVVGDYNLPYSGDVPLI